MGREKDRRSKVIATVVESRDRMLAQIDEIDKRVRELNAELASHGGQMSDAEMKRAVARKDFLVRKVVETVTLEADLKVSVEDRCDEAHDENGTSLSVSMQVLQRFRANSLAPPSSAPPQRAELVLAWLASGQRLDEVLGDAEENFALVAERHGARAARLWYRWHVVRYAGGRVLTLIGTLADTVGRFWKMT